MFLAQGNFAVDDIIPQIGPWVENIGTTKIATLFQDLFAFIEIFHILGLFMLGGATILVCLRLIGVGLTEVSPSVVEKNTRLWFNIGVIMAIVSGLMIGLSNAQKLYNNSAFLFKMLAMFSGIFFSYFVVNPVARADGKVGPGAKIWLLVALIIWVLGIVVMLTNVGSDVGVFHVIVAGGLVAFAALQGKARWILVAGLVALIVPWQLLTHIWIRTDDANMVPYDTTNKIFMWSTAAWIGAFSVANILGKAAPKDSNATARLIGFAAILVWVTVGAGGRWIGLT